MKQNIEELIQNSQLGSVLVRVGLSGNPRELSLVRQILHASAASILIHSDFLNDVKLAVTEACTNVMKHAYKYDPQKKFDLSVQVSPKLLVVKLTYEDNGFDPLKIPLPNFDKVQDGGFGVFIIRKVMDDVLYSTHSGSVVLRMVKILDSANVSGGNRED